MIFYLIVAVIGLAVAVPAFLVWLLLAVLEAVVQGLMWLVISFIALVYVIVQAVRGEYSDGY